MRAPAILALVLLVGGALHAGLAAAEEGEATFRGKGVNTWVLRLGQEGTRPDATAALLRIGQPALARLGDALVGDADRIDRRHVLYVLKAGQFDLSPIVDSLRTVLREGDETQQRLVLRLLMGRPGMSTAIPEVLIHLDHTRLGHDARRALRAMRGQAPVAAASLADALKHDDPDVRLAVLLTLHEVAPRTSEHHAAVVASLFDADAAVRDAADTMLPSLDQPLAFDILLRLSTDEKASRRAAVARPMLEFHATNAQAMAIILRLLKDTDATVRAAAAHGMSAVERLVPGSLPALVEMLKDRDQKIRLAGVAALSKAGSAALPATPALMSMMSRRQYLPAAQTVLEALWPHIEAQFLAMLKACNAAERAHLLQVAHQRGVPATESLRAQWSEALVTMLTDESTAFHGRNLVLALLSKLETGDKQVLRMVCRACAQSTNAVRNDVKGWILRSDNADAFLLGLVDSNDSTLRDFGFHMLETAYLPDVTPRMLAPLLDADDASTRMRTAKLLLGITRPMGAHRIDELSKAEHARLGEVFTEMMRGVDEKGLLEVVSHAGYLVPLGKPAVEPLLLGMDIIVGEVPGNNITLTLARIRKELPDVVTPPILARLRSDNALQSIRAAQVLAWGESLRGPRMAEVDEVLRVIQKRLRDPDPAVCKTAIGVAGLLKKRAATLFDDILSLFESGESSDLTVAFALTAIAPKSIRLRDVLLARFQDRGQAHRSVVPHALATMGDLGLDALLQLLDPTDPEIHSILAALGNLPNRRSQIVPVLQAFLGREDLPEAVRRATTLRIQAFGEVR